jgi:hypothetical protein
MAVRRNQPGRIIRPEAEDFGWQAGSSSIGPDHPTQMSLGERLSQRKYFISN